MTHFKTLSVSRVVVVVAMLFLALSATAQAERAKNFPNIKNFGQISDTYYRGGQPEGRDFDELAKFGIKTVINLTSDDALDHEKAMVEEAGMKYIQIPMTTHVRPTSAQLVEFLRIVNDATAHPVYVHCVGGKHRTGVMTAVYRMTQGWTADQAFKEMKKYKFGPDFLHSEFKDFVFDYFSDLAQSRTAPVNTAVTAASVQ